MAVITVDENDPVGELEPSFPYREVKILHNVDMREYYDLKEEIGRGKFGTVYKCQEKKTGIILAAKFVGIAKKQDRANVEREVEIMKTLQHPRLIQLYDSFEMKNVMCVVLELIEGGELFERVIDDDFILTEKSCTVFMRQICEGVQFIHQNNIIHLDLKPENILCLTKTGNRIKIIDFGLARRYEPDKKLQVLFGTPEFVAPEVVNFDQITTSTDMWSVGVICYVLLSGLSPFMGESDLETMTNVTLASYDFDDEAFDNISKEAKDFISKLLVKNKEDRLTATECLSHPWLYRKPPGLFLDASKENLKSYVENILCDLPFDNYNPVINTKTTSNIIGLSNEDFSTVKGLDLTNPQRMPEILIESPKVNPKLVDSDDLSHYSLNYPSLILPESDKYSLELNEKGKDVEPLKLNSFFPPPMLYDSLVPNNPSNGIESGQLNALTEINEPENFKQSSDCFKPLVAFPAQSKSDDSVLKPNSTDNAFQLKFNFTSHLSDILNFNPLESDSKKELNLNEKEPSIFDQFETKSNNFSKENIPPDPKPFNSIPIAMKCIDSTLNILPTGKKLIPDVHREEINESIKTILPNLPEIISKENSYEKCVVHPLVDNSIVINDNKLNDTILNPETSFLQDSSCTFISTPYGGNLSSRNVKEVSENNYVVNSNSLNDSSFTLTTQIKSDYPQPIHTVSSDTTSSNSLELKRPSYLAQKYFSLIETPILKGPVLEIEKEVTRQGLQNENTSTLLQNKINPNNIYGFTDGTKNQEFLFNPDIRNKHTNDNTKLHLLEENIFTPFKMSSCSISTHHEFNSKNMASNLNSKNMYPAVQQNSSFSKKIGNSDGMNSFRDRKISEPIKPISSSCDIKDESRFQTSYNFYRLKNFDELKDEKSVIGEKVSLNHVKSNTETPLKGYRLKQDFPIGSESSSQDSTSKNSLFKYKSTSITCLPQERSLSPRSTSYTNKASDKRNSYQETTTSSSENYHFEINQSRSIPLERTSQGTAVGKIFSLQRYPSLKTSDKHEETVSNKDVTFDKTDFERRYAEFKERTNDKTFWKRSSLAEARKKEDVNDVKIKTPSFSNNACSNKQFPLYPRVEAETNMSKSFKLTENNKTIISTGRQKIKIAEEPEKHRDAPLLSKFKKSNPLSTLPRS